MEIYNDEAYKCRLRALLCQHLFIEFITQFASKYKSRWKRNKGRTHIILYISKALVVVTIVTDQKFKQ